MFIYLSLQCSGYGQTKWVAERIVGQAKHDFGVPVIIIRTGLIGAHSTTGACAKDDLTATFIQGMALTGCRPEGFFKITLTPVDLVSWGMITVGLDEDSYGKVFHMIRKELISLQDIADALEFCSFKLKLVTYSQFCKEMKESKEPLVWQLAAVYSYLDHWDTYLVRNGADAILEEKEARMRPQKALLVSIIFDLIRQGKITMPQG